MPTNRLMSRATETVSQRRRDRRVRGSLPALLKRCAHTRRIPSAVKRRTKDVVLAACGYQCVYCERRLTRETVTLDHVHPMARGGKNRLDNLVAACVSCNHGKADLHYDEFFDLHPAAADTFLRLATAAPPHVRASAAAALVSPYADGDDYCRSTSSEPRDADDSPYCEETVSLALVQHGNAGGRRKRGGRRRRSRRHTAQGRSVVGTVPGAARAA